MVGIQPIKMVMNHEWGMVYHCYTNITVFFLSATFKDFEGPHRVHRSEKIDLRESMESEKSKIYINLIETQIIIMNCDQYHFFSSLFLVMSPALLIHLIRYLPTKVIN